MLLLLLTCPTLPFLDLTTSLALLVGLGLLTIVRVVATHPVQD